MLLLCGCITKIAFGALGTSTKFPQRFPEGGDRKVENRPWSFNEPYSETSAKSRRLEIDVRSPLQQ